MRETPTSVRIRREIETAARSLGIASPLLDVRKTEDIGPAFDSASNQRVDALIVGTDTVTQANRQFIALLAARHRLPAIRELGISPCSVEEVLRQMLAQRVAHLTDAGNPNVVRIRREIETAARSLGIASALLDVRKTEDIGPAFDSASNQRVDALIVGTDTVTQANRQFIALLAASKFGCRRFENLQFRRVQSRRYSARCCGLADRRASSPTRAEALVLLDFDLILEYWERM